MILRQLYTRYGLGRGKRPHSRLFLLRSSAPCAVNPFGRDASTLENRKYIHAFSGALPRANTQIGQWAEVGT
jgi:hypothetical protein